MQQQREKRKKSAKKKLHMTTDNNTEMRKDLIECKLLTQIPQHRQLLIID